MLHLVGRGDTATVLMQAILAARPDAQSRIVALDYGSAIRLPDADLRPGAWVFLGIDRLDDDSAFAAMQFRARLAQQSGIRFFNHPTRTRHRFEVLRLLHDEGINTGDVYRLEDRRPPVRWPVLLRDETAPLSLPLAPLADAAALQAALAALERRRQYRPSMLIAEVPGLAAGPATLGHVRMVGGRVLADPEARRLLDRSMAQRLTELFRRTAIAVGTFVLAPVAGGMAVVDAGTDPVLLVPRHGGHAVPDALLALADGP